MKILLINPMASRKAPVKGRSAHFPVGLGLIASILKAEGHTIDILDNETECLTKHELSEYLKKSEHDIYGITAMAPQYNYVKQLSRMIKELTGKPIILGGPMSTYSSNVVLKNMQIDICVIGEGEETAADLLENLDNLNSVAGIAFKESGNIIHTAPRVFNKSRDEYPFPAYELFNMRSYFGKHLIHYEGWGSEYLNKHQNRKNIGIVTGIGCPYHCRFCSRSVIKPRLRSIDNIIAEIKYLKETLDIDGVVFIDDLLIINEKRTLELCKKIKPLNIAWSGQARTNTLNEKLAKAIKAAGCVGVGLGIESGSERMLKAMKKMVTIADHKRAISAAKNNGLAIKVQILFGYPGENRESAEETIRFFKEVELPQRRFNILTPLPGSEVYDVCIKNRTITDEGEYLESVSVHDAGFGSKKVLLNLTEMSDGEFEALLLHTEKRMEDNYKSIFKSNHKLWFLLALREFFERQLRRIQKAASISAWKRKYNLIVKPPRELKLTKKQVEELYFNL